MLVLSRDPAKAAALADELSGELTANVVAAASYAEALDGAHIACATTHAVEPVVRREWLTPGMHITSVGYNRAGREIDDPTVTDALVCVESRAAALASFPAGSNDLPMPSVTASSPQPCPRRAGRAHRRHSIWSHSSLRMCQFPERIQGK